MSRDNRRDNMGCLTDCVAFYFNLHPERVPFFIFPRKGWIRRLKAFYRRRGYRAYWRRASKVPKRGLHIVCGDSLVWKQAAHAVVYRDGRLVFNPNRNYTGREFEITHRLVVRRTK